VGIKEISGQARALFVFVITNISLSRNHAMQTVRYSRYSCPQT